MIGKKSTNPEYGSISGTLGDIRQMFVISKNEIRKFLRGSRILLFSVLLIAVLALMTLIPYLFSDGYDSKEMVGTAFIMFVPMIVELAVVLFTAPAIVSEFEERTALILFTKPVKKSTIFLGKLCASVLIVSMYTIVYYLYVIIFSLISVGGIPSGIGTSLVIGILGVFGCSGIAMLMSSLFKKSSTASIMTLVVIMLLLSLVASMLEMVTSISTAWELNNAFNYCTNILDTTKIIPTNDLYTACGVLAGYGIICNLVAYLLFSRRDF